MAVQVPPYALTSSAVALTVAQVEILAIAPVNIEMIVLVIMDAILLLEFGNVTHYGPGCQNVELDSGLLQTLKIHCVRILPVPAIRRVFRKNAAVLLDFTVRTVI